MTVRINKQKINLREKLTEFEDKVNFDEVVRGLGEYTGNVGIGTASPAAKLDIGSKKSGYYGPTVIIDSQASTAKLRIDDESNNAATSRMYITHNYIRTTDVGGYVADTDSVGVSKLGFDDGNIIFANAAAGALVPLERMRITSSGNVGIGTTAPDTSLHISSSAPAIRLTDTTPETDTVSQVWADSDSVGALFLAADITSVGTSPFISARIGGTGVAAEKMRIDSDGNVGINTTPTNTLDIYRNTTSTSHNVFTVRSDVGGTNKQIKFKVTADGSAYTGSTPLTSDNRLKHNEQQISEAIQTLGKIIPRKYIKTSNLYETNHDFEIDEDGNPVDENGEVVEHRIEAGIIAQEVMDVPELAFAVRDEELDEDGNTVWPYSLDYNSLFTYAIAAIQEQQSIIEDLKSRIETLESK